MAGDLTYDLGLPITLHFGLANATGNATQALTLAQGGAGFVVPTGYKFHPLLLQVGANEAVTAGSAVAYLSLNTTSQTTMPHVTLSDSVQRAQDTGRVGQTPFTAGQIVAINFVQDANFAPNTADIDAILAGVLLPA
jgi:hypothetical protein